MTSAQGHRTLDLTMLHVLPNPLVRIELGRIRREKEELEATLGGDHIVLVTMRGVGRAAIDDEKDRSGTVVQQFLAELDEPGGGHTALEQIEMQLSPRADRRNHVDRGLLAGCGDHRGLPDRGPGGAAWWSVRMPASSAKKMVVPASAAAARIAG